MLSSPTPFPYVGSYALAELDGEHQLARILARRVSSEGTAARQVGSDGRATEQTLCLVGFPLRDGAAGTREIPEAELIDATPLTPEEAREYHDLDRALGRSVGQDGGRTKKLSAKQKAERARRDALRQRIVYGPILDRLMRFLPPAQRPLANNRRAA